MSIAIWLWIAAIIVFAVIEAATVGLVSIWFVAGSVVALIVSVFGGAVWLQFLLFAVVSGAAVLATRPLLKKFRGSGVATNADRVIGQCAKVTEGIDNENSLGAVYIDGKTWTARSAAGEKIPEGCEVFVERIEGVKLIVNKSKKKEEAVI